MKIESTSVFKPLKGLGWSLTFINGDEREWTIEHRQSLVDAIDPVMERINGGKADNWCKVCRKPTDQIFNIDFKKTPICAKCEGAIVRQSANARTFIKGES